jgi:hypothetical protein
MRIISYILLFWSKHPTILRIYPLFLRIYPLFLRIYPLFLLQIIVKIHSMIGNKIDEINHIVISQ